MSGGCAFGAHKDNPNIVTANTARSPRTPQHTTDADGAAVVLVPLANYPQPAKLLAEDFERLMLAGISHMWTLNIGKGGHGYVRLNSHRAGKNLISVARLVMAPRAGQQVRYRDGDRLNLRRDNLYVTDANGLAFAREAALMERGGGDDGEGGASVTVPPVPLPPSPHAGA